MRLKARFLILIIAFIGAMQASPLRAQLEGVTVPQFDMPSGNTEGTGGGGSGGSGGSTTDRTITGTTSITSDTSLTTDVTAEPSLFQQFFQFFTGDSTTTQTDTSIDTSTSTSTTTTAPTTTTRQTTSTTTTGTTTTTDATRTTTTTTDPRLSGTGPQTCQTDADCRNLPAGHICVANITYFPTPVCLRPCNGPTDTTTCRDLSPANVCEGMPVVDGRTAYYCGLGGGTTGTGGTGGSTGTQTSGTSPLGGDGTGGTGGTYVPPVTPPGPVCGNRTLETGEECDDGNLMNGDGCSSGCKIEGGTSKSECGNGIVEDDPNTPEKEEECDPPDGKTCSAYCKLIKKDLCKINNVTCPGEDACHLASECDPNTGLCKPAVNKADGASCADADLCNGDETCQAGKCAAGVIVNCTPSDGCHTVGVCNTNTGTCSPGDPIPGCCLKDSDCNDGLFCNGTETCQNNKCTAGKAPTFDDGNPCTDDICDETTKTGKFTPNTKILASDGNACTQDACKNGSQYPSVANGTKISDDGNLCTDDLCQEGKETHPNNTAPCDDKNACTEGDKCNNGFCQAGTPLKCDNGLFCDGTETCDPATGCKGGTTPATDDGVACTNDKCDETNDTVIHNPDNSQCADDGNVCTQSVCDIKLGCQNKNVLNGTACNDNDLCTQNDSCGNGKCGGQQIQLAADDPSDCMGPETCEPKVGKIAPKALADGTFCNDGKMCTLNDQCTAGACTGSPKTKTSNDPCIFYECDGPTGNMISKNSPDGTVCDDSKFCTTGDACKTGACTGGTPKDCNDSKVCTSDSCDEVGKSCKSSSIEGCCTQDSECGDGNSCTTDSCVANKCTHANIGSGSLNTCGGCTTLEHKKDEACSAGEGLCQSTGKYICEGTDATKCNAQPKTDSLPDLDDTPCTDDVCENGKQVTTNTTSACEDGNICTTGDVCSAGKCVTGKTVTYADEGCQAFVCVKGTKTPQNTGKACNDNDACTGEGSCQADGTCSKGSTISCDDGNKCTPDSCDPQKGCQFGAPLSCPAAADACHTAGSCDATTGACSEPIAKEGCCLKDADCNDGNSCTTDSCDLATNTCKASAVTYANEGCQVFKCVDGVKTPQNTGNACDDKDACTGEGTCQADGTCQAGQPVTYADTVCQSFTCVNGVKTPKDKVGSPCDDGDACTENDVCGSGDFCQGTTKSCDDSNTCTKDSCETATGQCKNDGGKPNTCGGCQTLPHQPGEGCSSEGDALCQGSGKYVCDETDAVKCNAEPKTSPLGDTDNNLCTDDSCEAGKEVHKNNTASCSDDKACTEGDQCSGGSCQPGKEKICTASDVCHTTGVCNTNTGTCSPGDPISGCCLKDSDCDNGTFCDGAESCQNNKCVPGQAKTFDDGNICTDDTCDETTKTGKFTPNNNACDDGSACTDADKCTAGACAGTTKSCDDSNTCTKDSCDAATGQCKNDGGKPNACGGCATLQHNKDEACTVGEGACAGTGQYVCDGVDNTKCNAVPMLGDIDDSDGNVCTGLTCQNGKPVPKNLNGISCSDDNTCTEGDQCSGGQCKPGKEKTCSASDACHTAGSCDATTGTCLAETKIAGCCLKDSDCDNGTFCDGAESCQNNKCVGGTAPTFNDTNPCTDDACDEATKAGKFTPNSAACDDGKACTTGDQCSGGQCNGAETVCPAPSDACHTAGSCDATTGTCPAETKIAGCCLNDSDCDNGTFCDGAESCQNNKCTAGKAPTFDDGNPCTDDSCDPATGQVHTPNTAACDDGSACTSGDVCANGTCQAGILVDCDDQDKCTTDTCNPDGSCAHAKDETIPGCKKPDEPGKPDPGKPEDEKCKDKKCDDLNPCTEDSCDKDSGNCVYMPDQTKKGMACKEADLCNEYVCNDAGMGSCEQKPITFTPPACMVFDGCDPEKGPQFSLKNKGSDGCSDPLNAPEGFTCNADCQLVEIPPKCGNNKFEDGETCDVVDGIVKGVNLDEFFCTPICTTEEWPACLNLECVPVEEKMGEDGTASFECKMKYQDKTDGNAYIDCDNNGLFEVGDIDEVKSESGDGIEGEKFIQGICKQKAKGPHIIKGRNKKNLEAPDQKNLCEMIVTVTLECGDGTKQLGEFCDDGNKDNTDGCLDTCAPAACGDGKLDAGEVCDDGNLDNNDGCNTMCQPESCGDGVPQTNEECEDGNTEDNDKCSGQCKVEVCGDGVLQDKIDEKCDDGNQTDGDGCNQQCVKEPVCTQAGVFETATKGVFQVDIAGTSATHGCVATNNPAESYLCYKLVEGKTTFNVNCEAPGGTLQAYVAYVPLQNPLMQGEFKKGACPNTLTIACEKPVEPEKPESGEPVEPVADEDKKDKDDVVEEELVEKPVTALQPQPKAKPLPSLFDTHGKNCSQTMQLVGGGCFSCLNPVQTRNLRAYFGLHEKSLLDKGMRVDIKEHVNNNTLITASVEGQGEEILTIPDCACPTPMIPEFAENEACYTQGFNTLKCSDALSDEQIQDLTIKQEFVDEFGQHPSVSCIDGVCQVKSSYYDFKIAKAVCQADQKPPVAIIDMGGGKPGPGKDEAVPMNTGFCVDGSSEMLVPIMEGGEVTGTKTVQLDKPCEADWGFVERYGWNATAKSWRDMLPTLKRLREKPTEKIVIKEAVDQANIATSAMIQMGEKNPEDIHRFMASTVVMAPGATIANLKNKEETFTPEKLPVFAKNFLNPEGKMEMKPDGSIKVQQPLAKPSPVKPTEPLKGPEQPGADKPDPGKPEAGSPGPGSTDKMKLAGDKPDSGKSESGKPEAKQEAKIDQGICGDGVKGDGIKVPYEDCDGDQWGKVTSCADLKPGTQGTLSCSKMKCVFNTFDCATTNASGQKEYQMGSKPESGKPESGKGEKELKEEQKKLEEKIDGVKKEIEETTSEQKEEDLAEEKEQLEKELALKKKELDEKQKKDEKGKPDSGKPEPGKPGSGKKPQALSVNGNAATTTETANKTSSVQTLDQVVEDLTKEAAAADTSLPTVVFVDMDLGTEGTGGCSLMPDRPIKTVPPSAGLQFWMNVWTQVKAWVLEVI